MKNISKRSSTSELSNKVNIQREILQQAIIKRIRSEIPSKMQGSLDVENNIIIKLVNQEVSEFFRQNKSITELSVKTLRQSLVDKLKQQQPIESSTVLSLPKLSQTNISQSGDLNTSLSPVHKPQVSSLHGKMDEWALITNYDYEQYVLQKRQEAQKKAKNRIKNRQDLDQQVYLKQQRLQQEKIEEKDYSISVIQQTKIELQKQKEIENLQKQKSLEQKALREQQIQQLNTKRKKEQEQERLLDDEYVKQARLELYRDQVKMQQKKEKEKQRFQEILKLNESMKLQSLAQAQKEKELEVKLQQEYLEQLRIQEEKREKELRQREERVKQLMSHFEETVGKSQAEKERQEDLAYIRQLIAKGQREAEEEAQIKKMEMEKYKKMKNDLDKQMLERKRLREQMDLENKKFIQSIQEQDQLSNQQEREKLKLTQLKRLEHARSLRSQMMQSSDNSSRMNSVEYLHNKQILDKISLKGSQIN